tara:strand:+ start:680 stop:847 length:168 start_codon:yes stop_codon:yes gene_type:complete
MIKTSAMEKPVCTSIGATIEPVDLSNPVDIIPRNKFPKLGLKCNRLYSRPPPIIA